MNLDAEHCAPSKSKMNFRPKSDAARRAQMGIVQPAEQEEAAVQGRPARFRK